MRTDRFIAAIGASVYFSYYILTYQDWHFIDNVNLIIHEAGHFIFIFLGDFMHLLGGSLTQIIIPVIFIAYFYKRYEYFAASLLLFWLGQNLINVSVYMSDATTRQLPLLGGEAVKHDWYTLFSKLQVLNQAETIGLVVLILGITIILATIILSLILSFPALLQSTKDRDMETN